MSFSVVIPARYDASRLPGKPLLLIAGKPLIQHVYECASKSDADRVIVATDDQRIADKIKDFGGEVCMTASTHQSGTERLAEVISKLEFHPDAIVVNLQGDEPLMPAECINQVAACLLKDIQAKVATLCTPIDTADELFDPNIVKVISDINNLALYFSRASIPWHRDAFKDDMTQLPKDGTDFMRHVGLYAYRAGFIKEYLGATKSKIEQVEALEQLRVLWHGEKIHVAKACASPGIGVDTEKDLEAVRQIIET
jgi:3-deoxy-manno-octulosonate cytidylyltransferase (CMP-KDO synthetase)